LPVTGFARHCKNIGYSDGRTGGQANSRVETNLISQRRDFAKIGAFRKSGYQSVLVAPLSLGHCTSKHLSFFNGGGHQ
jgi:hypothetical protein